VSPELVIRGVPADAKSLALIVDDPDAPDPAAPRMIWTHWVLYNLPPDTTTIPEGARPGHGLPASVREGRNDWGEPGYRGPCPPIGRHRYFFRVYALDTMLSDLSLPTRAKLLQAIKGHVLDQAELVGLYEKQR
ncbi:MAG: YbhB/YbcL family Raf kinase inhibitor-like protein, partial [Zetaproteobacteria bacterium]